MDDRYDEDGWCSRPAWLDHHSSLATGSFPDDLRLVDCGTVGPEAPPDVRGHHPGLADLLLYDDELADWAIKAPEVFLDIPFVRTEDQVIRAMLDLAAVDQQDTLYDLGCGDGRIVVAAALWRGARAFGVDLDPLRIAEAMEHASNHRVEHLVEFQEADLRDVDLREASVVCLYLLDSINLELRPRLQQELRPGARIVSHAFDMGDWTPDRHVRCGRANIYKWIVPAQVAGSWEWHSCQGSRYELELEQKHQILRGRLWIDGREVESLEGRVRGKQLCLRYRQLASQTVSVLQASLEAQQLVFLDTPGGAR